MVSDWLQTPLLRALRNKLSRRPLSAFDNCPDKCPRLDDATNGDDRPQKKRLDHNMRHLYVKYLNTS